MTRQTADTSDYWPDVAGPLEFRIIPPNSGEWFTRNIGAVLLFEQPGIVTAWEFLPASIDPDRVTLEVIRGALHRLEPIFRPWATPDPNPIPELDLFPKITRLLERIRP